MPLEEWQRELRRQYGRKQRFRLENLGSDPVFSDFRVSNPAGGSYRVAIRGAAPGANFCSCVDFRTNALGTCKHVEFTLARLARSADGRTALRRGPAPARYSSIAIRYGARREVRFRPGTDCPPALARLAARYFDADGLVRPAALVRLDRFLAAAARFDHDLRCYDDVLALIAEGQDADRRRKILDTVFPHGVRSDAFDSLLRTPLYDYQREGALFAARAGRCLIADEMGLGKTVQALAAAEILARHLDLERVLVVCPGSLVHQWEREVARFTSRSAVPVAGTRAQREAAFAATSCFKITSYDVVHRDVDLIGAWLPDLVIVDEAQRMKNFATRTARSVKQIAAPHAIVLTGTPLENRLEELVSIVEFVDQYRLGPTFRLLHDHQLLVDDSGRVVGYRDLDRLGRTLAPILVRRQKAAVLKQLPERLEKTLVVAMTPAQRAHHEEHREVVARLVAKWRRHKFLADADQRRLRIALQYMRMACDSTYLLDGRTEDGEKVTEVLTLLEEILERPEAKVVVFSQWLRMQELLARRVAARGWDHVLFHGGVPLRGRARLVDRFRDDPRCRVFLATDAGGVGLNLQHASVVVNVDLPWNPAVLEQRIGRVHRLGQERAVRVVNLVAEGTIEQGMQSLLGFKRSLSAGVLDGGEPEVRLGGTRLARFIETVEQATAAGVTASPAAVDACVGEPSSRNVVDTPDAPHGVPVDTEQHAGSAAAVGAVSAQDPLAQLLESGLALLGDLARATDQGTEAQDATRAIRVARDAETGEPYLRLRMPDPAALQRVVKVLADVLQDLRRS